MKEVVKWLFNFGMNLRQVQSQIRNNYRSSQFGLSNEFEYSEIRMK